MKLVAKRTWFTEKSTISELTVNGENECFVLEDPVREDGRIVNAWKLPGITAIPMGTYTVLVTPSQRFKRDLPLLLDVPGFSGVRIHPGNGPKDTEGCLLVGRTKGEDWIGESRAAFDVLFPKIVGALNAGEKVTMEVTV